MRVKAPSDVVEYIRSNFQLVDGEVVCICPNSRIGPCARFNHSSYSKNYIKDVLEGRDPDLSVLFDKVDGKLFRNQDPVWGTRKGTEVTKSGTKVCGVKVFNTGYIKDIQERPEFKKIEPKHIELKQDTPVLEPLVASEYERWCIKDRFRLKEGEVVYCRDYRPFGDYTIINNMHYSKGYVQQVLECKDPDVSDLFEFREGVICCSQDPIWGLNKGKRVKLAIICGAIFTAEGYVIPEPPKQPKQPVEYLGEPE